MQCGPKHFQSRRGDRVIRHAAAGKCVHEVFHIRTHLPRRQWRLPPEPPGRVVLAGCPPNLALVGTNWNVVAAVITIDDGDCPHAVLARRVVHHGKEVGLAAVSEGMCNANSTHVVDIDRHVGIDHDVYWPPPHRCLCGRECEDCGHLLLLVSAHLNTSPSPASLRASTW